MRLIKARDLGYEPAGTIFSNVSDFSAERVNRLKTNVMTILKLVASI